MKRLVTILALTAVLIFGAATPAAAHSFGAQGPPHQHATGTGACAGNTCYRWILFSGAIVQGNAFQLSLNYNYVLVLCSAKSATGGAPFNEGWVFYPNTYGPTGNRGTTHPYCHSPKYPTAAGLAGWAVNT